MKFLVIGYGSIGKRHAANALALGHEVVLLRHAAGSGNDRGLKEYASYDGVWAKEARIDGAIICSPTSQHLRDALVMGRKKIPFLLEKPPVMDLKAAGEFEKKLTALKFKRWDVAYNLRYYPVLRFIKEHLPKMGKIYCVRAYADYYLPHWRKGVDYRKTISASKALGGGVHRELVHEIDYVLWFLGMPEKVFGHVHRVSALEIDTEDMCSAILAYKNGTAVELHLGYLSQRLVRGCQIIAENGTLDWDMNSKKVSYQGKNDHENRDVFRLPDNYEFNQTYLDELEHFINMIKGRKPAMVSMQEAVGTMKVLAAIERSSRSGKWVPLITRQQKRAL